MTAGFLSQASAWNVGRLSAVAVFVVVVVTFILRSLARWTRTRHMKLPPSPPGYPVVGHLPMLMGPGPAKKMAEWRKVYGDTLMLMYGPKRLVVMHDYDTAKNAFSDDNTTGRDFGHVLNIYAKGRGLQQAEQDRWKMHRRFAIRSMRGNGMGKSAMEERILAEFDDLADKLTRPGGLVDPRPAVCQFGANVISFLAFGHRADPKDDRFRKIIALFEDMINGAASLTAVHAYPFLRVYPKFWRRWNAYKKAWFDVLSFLKTLIVEQQKQISASGNAEECYVNDYFFEAKRLRDQETPDKSFTSDQLLYSVQNLYTAGTETVVVTLLWGILYLALYPDIQAKAREEIDRFVLPAEKVRLEHRQQLKYCEAFVYESQRFASISSLGLMHRNFTDIVIDGYTIPADTFFLINMYSIHNDERYWEKPSEFRPERFFDSHGNVRIPKGFLPFSIGKRSCPGESLAKQELFLVLINLIHRFEICAPEDGSLSASDCKETMSRLKRAVQLKMREAEFFRNPKGETGSVL